MSAPARAPFFHRQLKFLARWFFTIYHDIRVEGAENIPSEGAVIVASNHPTYLDPAFLMVGVKRPIRFMAWERPFRVPLLGALMRAYGAIPVDIHKPGAASFQAAVRVLKGGEVFGIFPEGGRTKGEGVMNPFKSGVARLALITGAPIVPATILGGQRVWRRGEWLPKPGPITVMFHPPIRAEGGRELWRRDKWIERQLTLRLMAAINQGLHPAPGREQRFNRFPTILRNMLPWVILAAMIHHRIGLPREGPAACETLAFLGLLWMQAFRYPFYRRVRFFLLAAAYGAWLLWLWS